MAADDSSKRKQRKPQLQPWVPVQTSRLMRYVPWVIEEDPRFMEIPQGVIRDIISRVLLGLQEPAYFLSHIRHRVICELSFSARRPRPSELDVVRDTLTSDRYILSEAGWAQINGLKGLRRKGKLRLPSGEEFDIEIDWREFAGRLRLELTMWFSRHRPRQPKSEPVASPGPGFPGGSFRAQLVGTLEAVATPPAPPAIPAPPRTPSLAAFLAADDEGEPSLIKRQEGQILAWLHALHQEQPRNRPNLSAPIIQERWNKELRGPPHKVYLTTIYSIYHTHPDCAGMGGKQGKRNRPRSD
jgi:hypothetical protein